MIALCNHLDMNAYVQRVPNMTVHDGSGKIPTDGIEFNLPPDVAKQAPKSLLAAIRRMHINTGHPPNSELERVIRLADGSKLPQQVAQ